MCSLYLLFHYFHAVKLNYEAYYSVICHLQSILCVSSNLLTEIEFLSFHLALNDLLLTL